MPRPHSYPMLNAEGLTKRYGRRPAQPDGRGGPTRTSFGRPRIAALDVLRGFALCGILLANIRPIANIGPVFVPRSPTGLEDAHRWLHLLVDQRFLPIFSLLFGIGFSLLLDSAVNRAARPRLVMVRRLLVLLAIGLVHLLLLWRGRHPDYLRHRRPAGAIALDLAAAVGRGRPRRCAHRDVVDRRTRREHGDPRAVPAGLGTGQVRG